MTFLSTSLRISGSLVILLLLSLNCSSSLQAQTASSFELRYFSKDREANGITDFKGDSELFDTEQRVKFLSVYADVAGKWFMDTTLDRKVADEAEVDRFLKNLKAKPLPSKRKRIILDEWSKMGYRKGDNTRSNEKISAWKSYEGVVVEDGHLEFKEMNTRITKRIDTLDWRFHLSWKASSEHGNVPFSLALKSNNSIVTELGFHSNGNVFFTDNGYDRMGAAYRAGEWVDFKVEVDLVTNRYNVLVNGEKIGNWLALKNGKPVNNIEIRSGAGIALDEMHGLNFDTTACDLAHPYRINVFILEDFDQKADIKGWSDPEYDDSKWKNEVLPAIHGGELEAGEDLYLRKSIQLGPVERAFLNIETLDPGGEVWINGEVAFVTRERHPVKIDVTDYLKPHQKNVLAIRVFPFYNDGALYHSPHDRNIGWFCGRAWLDITEGIYIDDVKAYTATLGTKALQEHKIALVNDSDSTFDGTVEINYTIWHPNEFSAKAAVKTIPIRIFARDSVQLRIPVLIEDPVLWTHDNPSLYKVNVKLIRTGKIVDDEVLVTGIRTVSQEGGIFRINGEAELLGGAQTMGFRMPIENIAKWNRCPPEKILAEEILACKKMGNLLRIHVHAGGTYAYSVNDPRVAEMADQLGLMLIWPTSSWIRQGEWGGIDFEGYPKYMDQVFNSPSIVIWEGSNHPNRFEGKPLQYSNRFVTKMYQTIASKDSSRLISPSSYNRHFTYRNDAGNIDEAGMNIIPAPEWTAPLIVRGNQDALTGYGAQWHNIRKWPDPYRRSLIESKQHAYFNFEHEESIGMQNFSLAKGQPWYEMPSYENRYDQGSIGRDFEYSEWKESQAWQAFSAYESMKWQRMMDVDGFSWCCLHGGPNSGTYRKPVLDAYGNAKLAFYTNQMVLQDVMPGSKYPDVVYGKRDMINPVILNIGDEKELGLKVLIKDLDGNIITTKQYNRVLLKKGRTVNELAPFKHSLKEEGYYVVEYYVLSM